jgi:hypothetical protein
MLIEMNIFIIVIVSIIAATFRPYSYYFCDSYFYVCISSALELINFQIHLRFIMQLHDIEI